MLELVRVAVGDEGAFGVLVLDGAPKWVTLERTFEEGEESERVVIPEGHWQCTRTVFYKRGYPTFEIHVPGHSRVLFHKGNVEDDSRGCVLVGVRFGELLGKPAILDSAPAFDAFMSTFHGTQIFQLDVIDRKPGHVEDVGVLRA